MTKYNSKDNTNIAKSYILKYGNEKKSDIERRKKIKHKQTNAQALNKAMCRAVVRHPSSEVKFFLKEIQKNLRIAFEGQSDEAIEWLLGGGSEHGRGTFKDAQSFRNFLNNDELSNSRLISSINQVMVCIAYRAIGAKFTVQPHKPETEEQKKIFEICKGLYDQKKPVRIGSLYKGKYADCIDNNDSSSKQHNVIDVAPDDVSEVSDVNDDPLFPQDKLAEKKFRIINPNGKHTWVGVANKCNVDLRCHASGTTTLELAIMCSLLPKEYKNNPQVIKKVAGALIMTNMLRGDCHSLAETAAGIDYFVNPTRKEELHPHTCLCLSYEILESSVSSSVAGGNLKKALQHITRQEKKKNKRVKLASNQSVLFIGALLDIKNIKWLLSLIVFGNRKTARNYKIIRAETEGKQEVNAKINLPIKSQSNDGSKNSVKTYTNLKDLHLEKTADEIDTNAEVKNWLKNIY